VARLNKVIELLEQVILILRHGPLGMLRFG
jgi:hypothetical protein